MATDSSNPPVRSVIWVMAPAILLAGFAGGIAFPILPIAGERAGLSLAAIGFILAANRLTRIASNPVVGWLADRAGGKRTVLVGLLIQVVVMALYDLGVRTGHPGFFFLAGRLLHGPGSACVFVAGQALALTAGGPGRGGQSVSAVRAALGVGVPLGLAVGGLLSDRIGDAATFEVAGGALVIAWVAAQVMLPDVRVEQKQAVRARDAFLALADKRLAAIGALNFAGTFTASGMVLTTTVLLVQQRGLSLFGLGERGTAGAMMGVMVVVDALVMQVTGRVGDRYRAHGRLAVAGLVMLIPALLVVAQTHTTAGLLAGLALIGVGTGGLGPSLLAIIGRVALPEHRALSVGSLQMCGDVGGALGPLVGTVLFAKDVSTPYLAAAVLMAAFIPAAVWLARQTDRPEAPAS